MSIPEIAYEHYFKVPVCKRPEYTISFEEHINGTFAHCDVFRWNRTVRNSLLKDWNEVAEKHGGPLFVFKEQTNEKLSKFIALFGFIKLLDIPKDQEIWVWSKNG